MAGEMGGGWDTFCADNLSDVSGFTTSYSFEIVSLVIRPGTMRSEDKDENGTISTKHNSSLVIPSVIVMTMRRFLHAHMVVDTVSYMVADMEVDIHWTWRWSRWLI